jgi:hypothetical protein
MYKPDNKGDYYPGVVIDIFCGSGGINARAMVIRLI